MKTALLSIGFIVVSLFTLNSCGLGEAKTEAQAMAKIFHKHMKMHDYNSMANIIHEEGMKMTPREDWVAHFKSLESLGEIKSIKQDLNFNTSINNGVITVELSYTIKFADKTMTERLIFRKDSDTFKLMGYSIKKLEEKS
jgi:hypothetical protein